MLKVLVGLQVDKVLKEVKVHKVGKVPKELLELKVLKEVKVRKVLRDQQEVKEPKVLKGDKVHKELKVL